MIANFGNPKHFATATQTASQDLSSLSLFFDTPYDPSTANCGIVYTKKCTDRTYKLEDVLVVSVPNCHNYYIWYASIV
jgi:hypothetical protein